MNFGPRSTNLTLQGYTSFIVNDPSTAASQRWSDQEVKDAINLEYDALRAEIGTSDQGWTLTSDLVNTVADTRDHAMPSGFVGMDRVLIELDGKDIDSDSTANPVILTPTTVEIGETMWQTGDLTATRFWYIWEDSGTEKLAVVAPPSTGGTNSLKRYFRSSSTALSADGDAPLIPAPFHEVICYGAAVRLLLAYDLPLGDKEAIRQQKKARMLQVLSKRARDYEGRITAASLKPRKHKFRFGRAQRP